MPNILITGTNRGIGLELARQYAGDGWMVHACCRRPDEAADLRSTAEASRRRLRIHQLDVTDDESIRSLATAIGDAPIDILFNNAGDRGRGGETFGRVDTDAWIETLRINTIAPLRMAEAFVENVARSQRRIIANMTSRMGSIDDNGSGGSYAYRSSKAALNIVTKSLAIDLQDRGIIALVLHPGWVLTAMGGPSAPLTVQQSVTSLREVLDRLRPSDSGTFLAFDGASIPW